MFANKKVGDPKESTPPRLGVESAPAEKKHKKSKERKDKGKKKEKKDKGKKKKSATSDGNDDIKFSGAEIDPSDLILSKELGGGCFGKVWKGEVHGKPVAIKVPHVQNLDKEQLASLRNEIEIMR